MYSLKIDFFVFQQTAACMSENKSERLWPAEGGDPAAQLHVALRAEVIAADEQLHRVIPVSAGRVSPARTRQGRIKLQDIEVWQSYRETWCINVSLCVASTVLLVV